jgi:hypothetical protein
MKKHTFSRVQILQLFTANVIKIPIISYVEKPRHITEVFETAIPWYLPE